MRKKDEEWRVRRQDREVAGDDVVCAVDRPSSILDARRAARSQRARKINDWRGNSKGRGHAIQNRPKTIDEHVSEVEMVRDSIFLSNFSKLDCRPPTTKINDCPRMHYDFRFTYLTNALDKK